MRRIFAEAAAQGLPAPRITKIATGVRLSVFLAHTHAVGYTPAVPAASPAAQPPDSSRLGSRLESKLAAKVLLLLHAQECGKAALAQALGHRSVSGELHKQIRNLLAQGHIAMTLPDKPTSRLQRYRTTAQGQALLAQVAAEVAAQEKPVP